MDHEQLYKAAEAYESQAQRANARGDHKHYEDYMRASVELLHKADMALLKTLGVENETATA